MNFDRGKRYCGKCKFVEYRRVDTWGGLTKPEYVCRHGPGYNETHFEEWCYQFKPVKEK